MGILKTNLDYLLLASLKIENLWPEFIDAIGSELETQKSDETSGDDLTQYFNDIYNLPQDKLIELCNKFGYTPNLSLDTSRDFLVQESELISYKIRKKTSKNGYLISIKEIGKDGLVFNFYYTGNKIIKNIDWVSTFTNFLNNISLITKPFKDIVPGFYSNSLLDYENFILDSNQIMDDTVLWALDGSNIMSTKYVGVEYLLDSLENNSLLASSYFNYLDKSNSYNRSSLEITNSGANLAIPVSSNGSFNYYNSSYDYTIPDIQLKSAITHLTYSVKSSSPITLDNIKYISFGKGSKSLPDNTTGIGCLDYSNYIFFYTLDDSNSSTKLKDFSSNLNYMDITGNTLKKDGYLGKALNFNGQTSALAHNNIEITNTNMTLSFWLTLEENTNSSTLLNLSLLYRISYDPSNTTLSFYYLSNLVYTQIITPGNHYFILTEFDRTNNILNIFINNSKVYFQNTASDTYAGTNTLTLGSTNFIGYIESLSMTKNIYSSNQKSYIYNNKLSIITHLSKELYRIRLDDSEKYNRTTWWGVQSYAPLNSINEEYGFQTVTGTLLYTGFCNNSKIIPKTFGVTYTRIDSLLNSYTTKILDNGDGELNVNDWITGTINYSTGEYSIALKRSKEVLYQSLANTSLLSLNNKVLLDTNLINVVSNVVESSFKIFYSIGSAFYTAIDDGLGNIIGTYINSGTIDYVNGVIDIEFSQNTSSNTTIACQFSYVDYPIIENNSTIYLSYSVEDSLPITEIALENLDKEVLAYTTFPGVYGNSKNNYISPIFFIEQ